MENEAATLFTEEEQKIRGRWLLFAIKIPLVFMSLFLLIGLVDIFADFDGVKLLGLTILAAIIFSLLYGYYYCAYKKPGTFWLACTLVLTPLQIIKDLVDLRTVYLENDSLTASLVLLITAGAIAYSAFLFYLSYNLRKANKRVRYKMVTSEKEYVEAFSQFQAANTIQELDVKFQEATRNCTNSRVQQYIGIAYGDRKKSLENKS